MFFFVPSVELVGSRKNAGWMMIANQCCHGNNRWWMSVEEESVCLRMMSVPCFCLSLQMYGLGVQHQEMDLGDTYIFCFSMHMELMWQNQDQWCMATNNWGGWFDRCSASFVTFSNKLTHFLTSRGTQCPWSVRNLLQESTFFNVLIVDNVGQARNEA